MKLVPLKVGKKLYPDNTGGFKNLIHSGLNNTGYPGELGKPWRQEAPSFEWRCIIDFIPRNSCSRPNTFLTVYIPFRPSLSTLVIPCPMLRLHPRLLFFRLFNQSFSLSHSPRQYLLGLATGESQLPMSFYMILLLLVSRAVATLRT